MKKNYVRPMMVGERFAANEYVAACGETEYGVYKFECTAGGGIYGGLYNKNWSRISNRSDSYHACRATHDAPIKDEFIEGYYDPDTDHNNGNEKDVYIWLEKDRQGKVINKHATENIFRESWERAKS